MDSNTLEIIDNIRSSESRERDKLDRITFGLIAGTLSLSASLVVNSTKDFSFKPLLLVSWISLTIALVAIVLAYATAILHFRVSEKGVREKRFSSSSEIDRNLWFNLTEVLNWASLVFLLLGLLFLVCFAFKNI